jgi:DNA polymerase III subunit epsilon
MVDGPLPESSLAELAVLIVDCQTTGATPTQGSVLELGWCVVCAADERREVAPQAHWVTLPAGERVSAQVRQLTGFHEGVLETAITPEDAWQRLRAVTSPTETTPAAIHYARFELSFLRAWAERFEPTADFPFEAVCLHAIACRLFPDLPRRNLRALAGFLGHGLHLERRSLGHVQATAFIWRRLVAELAARGITTWSGLEDWLARKERPALPRKRRYPLAAQSYRSLPDQPGVYRLLRSNGDVLYVGKAASLKKRVASHFTKQRGATERALEMLTQVGDIVFTTTSTALEAALLETETIKRLAPPYNVQLVQGERGVWFSAPGFWDASNEPSELYRFGPLASRYSSRALGALTKLLRAEARSASLRAASVGAPLRWAPDEGAFAAGWSMFVERHLQPSAKQVSPTRTALRIAQNLLTLSLIAEPTAATPEEEPEVLEVWDGPRVCRHLERAIAQAYQVLRRASWLCLLAHSSVAYREPSSSTLRFLELEGGNLSHAGELAPGTPLTAPATAPRTRLTTQRSFDAARYDSLRILTTELKRILRDGGDVEIRLSHSRALHGARLAQLLRLV